MENANQINPRFQVGTTVVIQGLCHRYSGVVKKIKGKKLFVLLRTTTTGALSEYSLRNDGTFVQVGYSKDDAAWGGYFYNK